jgi:hypothetical protein
MATTFAVPDGRVAMAATTYTGNGSTQAVSNAVNSVGMQPDLVWIKSRNQATNHALFDSVRGTGKVIQSNTTAAEATDNTTLTAFNASGFSLGAAAGSYVVNTSTYTFVGWCWKAGGTAVSNTAGTITSSVSANTTAGFSVVTFTGNTTAGATVGHGLGVAPGLILIKARTGAYDWTVYHSAIGATKYLILDGAYAALTDIQAFNNTAPTVNVFSLGSAVWANNSGAMVAYCWAPVAGYSAFGSYTGNGSADGPFIYTGFRPRWIMIKNITNATNWYVFDTSRPAFNVETGQLSPNLSTAEDNTFTWYDLLSNGFKNRLASSQSNGSGETYIYAAFAENPLKFSNAR